ncbi:MAG TPA: ABC transporter permease [Kiritimatiellia bacterium]|jgi:lipopolysaccharide transport system permease protein|nr:ABC transporter permease [Kiritimatiellia bacterium]HOR77651.1 ABC transporter permease [Anaerolineaceae bacterium]HOU59943.1 ABC transporter permease [Kiritimatiellia bacterium]HQF20606.1 ABC transporter permease [Kiritimatiellia bacterium]
MSTPSKLPVTVYTPDSSLSNPFVMIRAMFADLWKGRELAWRLTVRDISAQYRQTFLGILWALILPLANTVVWLYLNLTGIVVLQETPIPYPVYVFAGTMLWAIFMDSINAPMSQTGGAIGMLTKLNFPREALLLAGIYKTLFNSGIKLVLMLCILPFFDVNPGWGLTLFPLGVFSLILVGTAIGLFITPVGMLYTDVGRAMPLVMQFVMYATPVVFAMPKAGVAATLFKVNPLTPLILTARDWLTGGTPEYVGYFLAVNAAALILLLASWIGYRLSLPILIERMSA